MRYFLLNIAFIITCSLLSQTPQVMPKKTLKKGFPGVVPLEGDYLFIDETEVRNIHWKEFLFWLKDNDTAQYRQMLPDTQIWRDKLAYNEPFVKYYFQHPAYADYPLVGITYAQAQAYCQWRTERVLTYLRAINHPVKKLIYRLPSEQEWKKAAWGTLPKGSMWPWEGSSIRWKGGKQKNEGLVRFNFKRGSGGLSGTNAKLNDAGLITTPVYSYWPNTIGLYNICGNVAEWTEEHKAMGGSWNDLGYHCQITTPKPVLHDSTRRSTLGFRCVMEIIEYEDDYQIKPLALTAKIIEEQMKYIPDSISGNWLFASETETTNQLYHTFLNETKNSSHAIQNQKWANYTRYHAQKLYGWHQAYAQYPVVNIEYENAIAYCAWLTQKYNSMEKRTYKKVQFKLPTLQEWELASAGGRKHNTYPWGGPYTRNSKGCFLANYTPLETQYLKEYQSTKMPNTGKDTLHPKLGFIQSISFDSIFYHYCYSYPNHDITISRGIDGSYYPARVDAYFPNAYGLYNCVGNISEMLSEFGKAKGGSWVSSQYQIQIKAPAETYTGANPTLGFRVFMEVLER